MTEHNLRVALDARSAQYQGGGVARYTTGLIAALGQAGASLDFTFIVDAARPVAHLSFPPQSRFIATRCALNSLWRDYWNEWVLPRQLQAARIDVFHGPDYITPIGPVQFARVATFHDAIAFTALDGRGALSRWRLRWLLRQVARAADILVADSEFSRREIQAYLPVAQGKTQAVWVGLEADFFEPPPADQTPACLARCQAPQGYILYYGGYRRHKNVERLVRAFAGLARESTLQLVLVGAPQAVPESLPALIRELDLQRRVTFFGFASEVELRILLAHCAVFVFPSLVEGFGLPVAEALASGAPVVCSTGGSLPEIAGEAAVYFEPTSVPALAEAVQRVLADPDLQARLRVAGRARARLFAWPVLGPEIVKIYGRAHERKVQ